MKLSKKDFQNTESSLAAKGWKFFGKGKCSTCGDDIEWWETAKFKLIALDPGTLSPHWDKCKNATF